MVATKVRRRRQRTEDFTKVVLGNRVAKARRNAGLTQTDLASQVGVTQNCISRIESGVNGPSIPLVRGLATALGVTLDDLLR